MDESKNFFNQLNPKGALVVGLVGGVLSIGTIGFIVLGAIMLKNGSPATAGSPTYTQAAAPPPSAPAAPSLNVPKTGRPKVELFVMSYCPFGLQMEKALVPAWELLKNKADISVKFVAYAMHGKKEIDENVRQHCIETEQAAKYQAYLKCFFEAGQNDGSEAGYQRCLTAAGVNQSTLSSCISRTDKNFGVTAKYNDQGSWLSGRYPLFPIHADLNSQYGVRGSPTLVVNGVNLVSSEEDLAGCQALGAQCALYPVNRAPEALKEVICAAFASPPSECQRILSGSSYGAGFGTETNAGGAAAAAPGCGT